MADDARLLEPAELTRIDAAFPQINNPVLLADRAGQVAGVLRAASRRQQQETLTSKDVEAAIEVLRGQKGDPAVMTLIDRLHKLSSALDRLMEPGHAEAIGLASEAMACLVDDVHLRTAMNRAIYKRMDDSLRAYRQEEAEATRVAISRIVEERLVHVPYRIVQDILGAEDGGYASIFDSEAVEPYGGRFANRVGGPLLEAAISAIGIEKVVERSERIFAENALPAIGYRLPAQPEGADFDLLGKLAAAATVAHLNKALGLAAVVISPEMEARLAAYCVEYARSEHAFMENGRDRLAP